MQALVYKRTGRKGLEDRAKPVIQQATDAIVQTTKTTICGTDLHILKGDVPTCKLGTILGHEGVGSGPIGLAVLLTAQLYSPAQIVVIDLEDSRLAVAKRLGATHRLHSSHANVAD